MYILISAGQPLDGVNNLGSTWSALNSAIGAEKNKTLPMDLMEVELHCLQQREKELVFIFRRKCWS